MRSSGGLELLEEIGVEAVRRETSALTEDLISLARERGPQAEGGGTAGGAERHRDAAE